MAVAAVQTAMHLEAKSLHPFFSKAPKETTSEEQQSTNVTATVDEAHDDPEYGETSAQLVKPRKKRTRKSGMSKDKISSELAAKGQTSLERFARSSKIHELTESDASNSETTADVSLEEDPNQERRKRQKTVSPPPVAGQASSAQSNSNDLDWHRQLQVEAEDPQGEIVEDVSMDNTVEAEAHCDAQEPSSLPRPADFIGASHAEQDIDRTHDEVLEMQKTTPKKQIKVTKSGKLVSSPPKAVPESPKKRRGRPRTKPKVSPTVTVIKYGSGADLEHRTAFGQQIEEILKGPRRPGRRAAKIKVATTKPAGPPKPPHPFFTGKKDGPPAKAAPQQLPPTPRKSACTPGKLRAEARRDRSPEPLPAFGVHARNGRGNKQSGLYEASWPTSETAHVRNMHEHRPMRLHQVGNVQLALRPRKMKNAVVQLSQEEELVARLAQNLSDYPPDISKQHLSNFEPPEDVRLPTRLLTTGTEISRRVREQVLTRLGDNLTDVTHPLSSLPVARLFFDIQNALTPFDEGKCEGQTWNQKYSPQSTDNVLYNLGEAKALKDWLESLTIMAVGGALKASALADAKQPPRKKRKKAVDDFIVSDDEVDEDEMIEIPNVQVMPHLRSLRLSSWKRNKNVILISGPHGCGKSAMVHAVAKELGFEVFEINSGMRRAGKDIQDKVGDMTANHLVNHKQNATSIKEEVATADNIDTEQFDSALQDDITSGRQGTMTSFFQVKPAKPKSTAKPKHPVSKPPDVRKTTASAAQAVLPMITGTRKSQKQSLIFIEEADILFEEDQQFWVQVTKLAQSSKRPIVISCNDETQIPVHDLPLAAVLRLQPPPIDLATDYLLALAGREGHILERKAVENLYNAKNHDLRASINELDFWCQMSVGDRKGGLEWMYQRWPPGKDRDEHGDTLRVASEGTYQSGMGWLSHNVFETQANAVFDQEEELLQEVWTDWSISPNEWTKPVGSSPQNDVTQPPVPPSDLAMLERLDNFVDSLSAADIYSRIGLPTYPQHHLEPTDPTLPPIPEKARLSYTLAAPLLQVDPRTDFSSLDTSLYIQSRLLLSRAYPEFSPPSSTSRAIASETAYANSILASKNIPPHPQLLTRSAFASALDALASPPDALMPERTSYNLNLSSFDRTFDIITLDLAPYVRSIVAHERELEAKRAQVSSLLCLGGEKKRGRSTRAARTAIEGGVRETKRRERWFEGVDVDAERVLATAGESWAGMGWKGEPGEVQEGSLAGTLDGTGSEDGGVMSGSQDVVMEDRGVYGREITLDFSK
ncbi:hypothetical protein NX059_010934 [Plenodomus lindquistii]|nr:hypothetical protein NX059_010934 [Plenodomus lindquistii]